MLMFEFAHRVKKIHTEETSCLGRGDCAIMDFIDPIIICFQKNILSAEKKLKIWKTHSSNIYLKQHQK